jgi:predicted MFS family arabinose efflux permease
VGRIAGPALAGLTIGLLGIAPCFFLNAVSFVAVIVALLLMNASELHASPPQPRKKGQVREGVRVVAQTPELLGMLVMAAVFFGLAWMSDIVMPLIAKYTFNGSASMYGLFLSAMGVGAIVGALVTARTGNPSQRLLTFSAVVVTFGFLAAAAAPTFAIEMLTMLVLGAAGAIFIATLNSRLQLQTPAEFRGRVMALWTIAAMGTRPIGAPIVGAVGQHLGPRYAMVLAAVAVGAIALPAWWLISLRARRPQAVRTAAATEPSTPFTNRPDSSVEKRLASSTASERIAPVGTSLRSRSS